MATASRSSAHALPDWDVESPALSTNLASIYRHLYASAIRRDVPTFEDAREWHKIMMVGLNTGSNPAVVGGFRGETGLYFDVAVGKAGMEGDPAPAQAYIRRQVIEELKAATVKTARRKSPATKTK